MNSLGLEKGILIHDGFAGAPLPFGFVVRVKDRTERIFRQHQIQRLKGIAEVLRQMLAPVPIRRLVHLLEEISNRFDNLHHTGLCFGMEPCLILWCRSVNEAQDKVCIGLARELPAYQITARRGPS